MIYYNSLQEVQQDLKSGKIDCVSLTKAYLANIKAKKELNAFLEVFEKTALQKAEEVQQRIQAGKAGKLAGMVIGIKDNICYKDHEITAASKILQGFQSLYSSTAVERLLAEDAIIIGRLNCDEFAMGGSNENSAYGNVLNPIDPTRVPGGSSGGSAAAVKANLCLATLGSDTGGSIRQPSAFCGTVGLKPTYGRVSRHGLIAYGSSFDQIGPITHTVEDTAKILEVIAGSDEYDTTASPAEVEHYSLKLKLNGKKKIAYFKECIENEGLDEEVKQRIKSIIKDLKADGHEVGEVDFPYLDYLISTYYILTTAEASSNLARYDGIHYGYRSKNATDLASTYKKSRTEGFGKTVKQRIMLGTFVLSSGYYDAYYSKAQKARRLVRDKTLEVLSVYDHIILPTAPHTAFKMGEQINDPIKMYLEDIFTVQANLCGIPAISLPLGQHSNGMPFGIQLMSKHFNESDLLAFSAYMMSKFN